MRPTSGGRQLFAAALVGAALFGAGCSSGTDNDAKATSQQGSASTPKSAIYGVRIFAEAVPDAASSAPGREVYRIEGKRPEVVASYYHSGFGMAGDADDRLAACAENAFIDGSPPFELTWRVGDTNDFVVVQVERNGAVEQPSSTLTIIDDKANTTRACTTP